MKKKTTLLFAAVAVCFSTSCVRQTRARPLPIAFPTDALRVVPPQDYPDFLDDMDDASLETALQRSLDYYEDLPGNTAVYFGRDRYSARSLRRSLKNFRRMIRLCKTPADREKAIRDHFALYKSTGLNAEGNITFSAYDEQTLSASLSPHDPYLYPIYAKPPDLMEIDMGEFNPLWRGKVAVSRFDGRFLQPYYTREEIDSKRVLQGKGLEIAWAKDPFDVYLLQVEGSGWLTIEGGTQTLRVRYAASNGHPYRSVGLTLIERGLMSKREITADGIRSYLQAHSGKRQALLNVNPRYVFFRLDRSDEARWAFGSLEVPLTPGRSVATDPELFPRGALGWIRTRSPQSLSRFVLNQDEGGAIKGPGRLDLFVGSAEDAIRFAGKFWQAGELYFLVLKD